MKSVPKSLALSLLVVCSVIAALSLAGGAVAQVTIDLVTVGNPGNPADTSPSGPYGAVAYSYDIGKYEVTNTQYAAFLTATAATDTYGLYNAGMDSAAQYGGGITQSGSSGSYTYAVKDGFGNKAVNYVSFWDATRFANWLNNGQGSGSTETGSYTLTSGGISANTVTRNGGANWVVASENEWYKAAYYDPTKNSSAGGYWLRATRSDTLGNNTAFTATNGANYYDGDYAVYTGSNDGALPVGSYSLASSFYGTFDQGGNLWEWNEEILFGSSRGLRGGSWNEIFDENSLRSSFRFYIDATLETNPLGFRVASLAPIPEPSTYAALFGLCVLGFAAYRRRRRQASGIVAKSTLLGTARRLAPTRTGC